MMIGITIIIFIIFVMFSQINKPDEFDCMLVFDIRIEPQYQTAHGLRSYCSLHILSPLAFGTAEETNEFVCAELMSERLLSPKAFKSHFNQLVNTALAHQDLKGYEIGILF